MFTTTTDNIWDKHIQTVTYGCQQIDSAMLSNMISLLTILATEHCPIFVAGNGASAALSQHWACDHLKGASSAYISQNVISLASNMALLTAIANDISYESVFTTQLQHHTTKDTRGALILISASGKSPNVVHTAEFAKKHRPDIIVMSLTGFVGEPLKSISHYNLHVPVTHYEEVEDVHHIIMHVLAKALRKAFRREE